MARTFLGPDSVKSAYGVSTRTTGGAPTDGSFAATPADGELAVDTTNHALYFRSGAVWRTPSKTPAVRAYHSTTQVMTTGATLNPVLFDTELYDTDGIHPGANNGEFIIVTPGLYLLQIHLELTTTPAVAASVYSLAYKNGTPLSDAPFVIGMSNLEETWSLTTGDIVKAGANNNTGSSLTINSGERNSHLALTRIGGI